MQKKHLFQKLRHGNKQMHYPDVKIFVLVIKCLYELLPIIKGYHFKLITDIRIIT